MRIVIDFQGVSETWRDTPAERRQMDLLRGIAQGGTGHDIVVALAASDKQLVNLRWLVLLSLECYCRERELAIILQIPPKIL